MSLALTAGLLGAAASLCLGAVEAAVLFLLRHSNTKGATWIALGIFGVAFAGRFVLLRAGPSVAGVETEQMSFSLGVIFALLAVVAVQAVVWTKAKR